MELYELMLIIRPDLETEEHQEVLKGLSDTIAKNNGVVNTVLDWRKRRLSYEIAKHREGHYYIVYFNGPGSIIPEIEHYFKVTDAFIRFMIVRSEEQDIEAAATKAAAGAEAADSSIDSGEEETAIRTDIEDIAEIDEPVETEEVAAIAADNQDNVTDEIAVPETDEDTEEDSEEKNDQSEE